MLLPGFALLEAQQVEAGGSNQNAPNPIRKICDPHTGMQWVLERDPSNPGGPGRMVLENGTPCHLDRGIAKQNFGNMSAFVRRQQTPIASAPVVIRAGDKLMIEEKTPRVETRLEAVALSSAVAGAEFAARLTFQGAIVRAVALEPGRASLGRALGLLQRP